MATRKRTRTTGRKSGRPSGRPKRTRSKTTRASARKGRSARPVRARAAASRVRQPVKKQERPLSVPAELKYRPLEDSTEKSDLLDAVRMGQERRPDNNVEREPPSRMPRGLEEP